MKFKLTLSEIIGKTISVVRCHYKNENEYGLQEFHSYLKLSNGVIIDFPIYDDEHYRTLTPENEKSLSILFQNGKELSGDTKNRIEGQKIIDLYFCYSENELDEDKRAYLKLSNGLYITEKSHGPQGLTDVNLLTLNEEEFLNRTLALKENVKSYLEGTKINL